jgi:hypothetical protein
MLWLAVGCPVASIGAAAGGPCEGSSRVEDDAPALVFSLVPGAGALLLAGVACEGWLVAVGGLSCFLSLCSGWAGWFEISEVSRSSVLITAASVFFPFVLFLMRTC